MLTQQHRFATRITHSHQRRAYKMAMCGLCHALGDQYGFLNRLLTNHEMILLNMLTNAQRESEPVQVMRRCPLNPMRQVVTNQDSASEFAAAAAVALANVSVTDDVQDSGSFTAQLAKFWLKRPNQTALDSLRKLNFDTATFTALTADQTRAEQDDSSDPAQPSANTSARLFAATARIAENPINEQALAIIGANYGAYLYLLDAYRDYPQDLVKGDFNPLRRYTTQTAEGFQLTNEGLRWLLMRFELILTVIRQELKNLHLHRYQDSLTALLCDPIAEVQRDLHKQLDRRGQLNFQRWTWRDAFKAALFILPAGMAGAGIVGLNLNPEEQEFLKEGHKQVRKSSPLSNCGSTTGNEETDCNPRSCGSDCAEDGVESVFENGCSTGANLFNCFSCIGESNGLGCVPETCDPSSACNGLGNLDCGGCDNVDCGGLDCNCSN